MDALSSLARDLLAHRAALIGAAVALVVGVAGGLALKTGDQTAPQADTYFIAGSQETEAQPVAWPAGKIADYVIGTDFTRPRPIEQPPVVVASYEVPEYTPAAFTPPEPEPAPVPVPERQIASDDRPWPSTQGDILDIRLPEDKAPQAPVAPPAPVALAAAY